MSDIIDDAQMIEERERALNIAAASQALRVEGSTDCVGCGEAIDEARRRAHPQARRCLPCQAALEARAYLGRGA